MKVTQASFTSGNYAQIEFNDGYLRIQSQIPIRDSDFVELGCYLISLFTKITVREAEGLTSLIENYLKSRHASKEIGDEDLFRITNASSDELLSAMKQLQNCYRSQPDYELRLSLDEARLLKDLVSAADNPDYAPLRKKLSDLL